ncbi:MAG: HD domain-containing protein [Firmicutes bacterium]|nr:HD domain-containing protein [Bacillota bacterium]
MKTIYAANVRPGDDIQDFFIVKGAAIKVGSTGKQYLDITVGDSTGDLNAKKWDVAPDDREVRELKNGDVVKIRGTVVEFNGQKQLRIQRIRKAAAGDEVEMSDFIKAAPEKPEAMYADLIALAETMQDEDLKKLATGVMEARKEKLLYWPAATRNHHAEYGGLLWHMKRMALAGDALCSVYTFLDRDLLLAGVLLHDMEKLNEIVSNEDGIASDYSKEGQLLGHIVMGVRELDKAGEALGIPREKVVLLEHMIVSHHYEPEYGSPKKPAFAEAEVLHYLDIMDARLFTFEEVEAALAPGEFSEKVFSLDNRRVYKGDLGRDETK